MRKKIQKFLSDSCILFTLFVFILYTAGFFLIDGSVSLSFGGVLSLLAICAVLSLFRRVLTSKKLPLIWRVLIHYILVLGSAFLAFSIIGKIISTSLQSLVMLSIITFLYSVFALISVVLESKPDSNEKEEYQSMFRK